jgi:hypothetical protein
MVRCVGLDIRVKKYVIGNGTIHSLTGGLQPVKHRARPASVGGARSFWQEIDLDLCRVQRRDQTLLVSSQGAPTAPRPTTGRRKPARPPSVEVRAMRICCSILGLQNSLVCYAGLTLTRPPRRQRPRIPNARPNNGTAQIRFRPRDRWSPENRVQHQRGCRTRGDRIETPFSDASDTHLRRRRLPIETRSAQ